VSARPPVVAISLTRLASKCPLQTQVRPCVIAVFGVRRGSASAHRHAMEPNAVGPVVCRLHPGRRPFGDQQESRSLPGAVAR